MSGPWMDMRGRVGKTRPKIEKEDQHKRNKLCYLQSIYSKGAEYGHNFVKGSWYLVFAQDIS